MNEKEYQEKRYGKEAPLFIIREATAAGVAVGRYGDSINIAYPESHTRRGRIGEEIAQTLLTSCEQVVICERNNEKEGEDGRTTRNTAYRLAGYSGPRHITESTRSGGDIPDSKLLWGGNLQVKIFDYSRFRVRKLTPTEYGRLQGFPMNTWRQVVSNSQAYKQFGNAVTVPLAEAIGKSIIKFLNEQEAEDGKDTASRPG